MRRVLWVVPALVQFVQCVQFVASADAHESLLRNIAATTVAIENAPEEAALYVQRGELYRLHRDWDAARADFERAIFLEPELTAVHFYLARMYLESGKPTLALSLVTRYLGAEPDDAIAKTTRARALAALGRPLEAVHDYASALEYRPTPELYLERANVLVAGGRQHARLAVSGLEEGVATLGPIPALELRIIELELWQGRVEAALVKLDDAVARSPQEIQWLVRRAEILEGVDENERARRGYEAAREQLLRLPVHRRRTRMFHDLEMRIMTALERLARD